MKITGHDMPTGKQADGPARAYAAVGSAELAFRSRQDVIDFIFHRLKRQPARRLRQSRRILVVNVKGFATDNIQHRSTMQIMECFCVRHDEVSSSEEHTSAL